MTSAQIILITPSPYIIPCTVYTLRPPSLWCIQWQIACYTKNTIIHNYKQHHAQTQISSYTNKIIKNSNTILHKYNHTQIQKYHHTQIQIPLYPNTNTIIHKCTNTIIHKYKKHQTQILKLSIIYTQIPQYTYKNSIPQKYKQHHTEILKPSFIYTQKPQYTYTNSIQQKYKVPSNTNAQMTL